MSAEALTCRTSTSTTVDVHCWNLFLATSEIGKSVVSFKFFFVELGKRSRLNSPQIAPDCTDNNRAPRFAHIFICCRDELIMCK